MPFRRIGRPERRTSFPLSVTNPYGSALFWQFSALRIARCRAVPVRSWLSPDAPHRATTPFRAQRWQSATNATVSGFTESHVCRQAENRSRLRRKRPIERNSRPDTGPRQRSRSRRVDGYRVLLSADLRPRRGFDDGMARYLSGLRGGMLATPGPIRVEAVPAARHSGALASPLPPARLPSMRCLRRGEVPDRRMSEPQSGDHRARAGISGVDAPDLARLEVLCAPLARPIGLVPSGKRRPGVRIRPGAAV